MLLISICFNHGPNLFGDRDFFPDFDWQRIAPKRQDYTYGFAFREHTTRKVAFYAVSFAGMRHWYAWVVHHGTQPFCAQPGLSDLVSSRHSRLLEYFNAYTAWLHLLMPESHSFATLQGTAARRAAS